MTGKLKEFYPKFNVRIVTIKFYFRLSADFRFKFQKLIVLELDYCFSSV